MISVQSPQKEFINASWSDTFDDVVNIGSNVLSTSQDVKDVLSGDDSIVQGSTGGIDYTVTTSSENKRQTGKVLGIPTPLFVGGTIVVGISVAFLAWKYGWFKGKK